ncbi:PREDICTED: junction-mediating and -regulatory protein-like [Galeopterus variegatus]|uniref:Junction-mediating and -regulatory protein-like n=1 Tax=Galeopterus variegatus TaxID=482537 RepID=A0ABM0RFH9_GALVR|nr:PREDICTED: junction-mediating and -regulatory protein-like [Galeopterus variegatus]
MWIKVKGQIIPIALYRGAEYLHCDLDTHRKENARSAGPSRGGRGRRGRKEGAGCVAKRGRGWGLRGGACVRRRRVTSVRHVPVFTSLVEQPTSAAEWQHCGDAEAPSLGDAFVSQARAVGRQEEELGRGDRLDERQRPTHAAGRPRGTRASPPERHRRGPAASRGGQPGGSRRCAGTRGPGSPAGKGRAEATGAATPVRSPGPRRSPAWAEGDSPRSARSHRGDPLLRSPAGRGAESSLKSPVRAKPTPARRGSAGRDAAPAAAPPTPREAPVSSVRLVGASGAVSEEIEVLEMAREDEAPLGLPDAEQPPASAELESPAEECSWAGLFSFQDLRAVHQQLCSVNSQLEPYLPVFPEEPSGMWTVLFGGAPEMTEQEIDTLCYQLQVYLGHGLDTCGWKILSQVLFTETDDPEEYYESLSELRQKGYEEVLQRARKRIQERARKEYWENLWIASSRAYNPSMSKSDAWGVTTGTAKLMQEKEATTEQQLKEHFERQKFISTQ